MQTEILDCIDLPCPKPVLRTKEALDNGAQKVIVTVDNEASKNNVVRFGTNQGCKVSTTPLGNDHFEITLTCSEVLEKQPASQDEYLCESASSDKLVYVISSDTMGRGSDELGWALLQTFIQTIKDVEPAPVKILFYNSGVKMVTEQSGALDALKALQENGTEILVCGTCLDFFNLKAQIQVGQISNMYEIMSSMTKASQVISPY